MLDNLQSFYIQLVLLLEDFLIEDGSLTEFSGEKPIVVLPSNIKRIDVIATAIKFGATVEDLKDLELCYAPPFSTAKDVVNYAGYVASNLLSGSFKQINVDKVRDLVENGAYIVDVRERMEFENGHIKGAINIPLSELRERANEIPKDKTVYLHYSFFDQFYNVNIQFYL